MSDLSWLPQGLQPTTEPVADQPQIAEVVIDEVVESPQEVVDIVDQKLKDLGEQFIENHSVAGIEVAVLNVEEKKSNVGRPTVMTEETLEKLKQAFLWGCTDNEACLYAEIDPKTLYNYQNEHDDYSSKKEMWKQHPILKARAVVVKAMESGDKEASKWYLERKKKTEFSTRVESTGVDGKAIHHIVEKLDSNYDEVAGKASGQMVEIESSL
jgi:hypothetical protein